MKKILTTSLLCFLSVHAFSQACDISIRVYEDRFMQGQAEPVAGKETKKIFVEFFNDRMEVVMPLETKWYKITVTNDHCRAYCSQQKRVRQLHAGDEKLVMNLFKSKEDDLRKQIEACSFLSP